MIAFVEKTDQYKTLIDSELQQYIEKQENKNSIVLDAMRYAVLNGGKRVRGILVMAFCEMLDTPTVKALPFACSIEMLHAYSLVHDDLPCMDNDDLRRGKPACHIKYGEDMALLAGDGLLTLAFHIISTCTLLAPSILIQGIRLLSAYGGINGMIGGQEVDLKSENKEISPFILENMHSLKTAALIQCACQLGILAAGGMERSMAVGKDFGYNLGMAFQIYDDILDVIGKEELLGKPIGSDKEHQKKNYIALFGLEQSKNIAQQYTKRAKECLSIFRNNSFLLQYTDQLIKREN